MRKGLPDRSKMRHDAHFVEELAKRSVSHIGSMVPLSLIDANPDQPRTHLGNLDELTSSVQEKGVLEPILVRQKDGGRYEIISGERRFRAATAAGLDEIPAIELDADDKEVLEIALIENIQRKDLTAFEESEGLQVLQEKFGYTHEKISQVIGKSRTNVTESLLLNGIPDRVRGLCREAGVTSKGMLVEIARAGSEAEMIEMIAAVAKGQANRADLRRNAARKTAAPKAGRPKNYTFQVKDRSLPFQLDLKFRKSAVDKDEVIQALREVLRRLEADA